MNWLILFALIFLLFVTAKPALAVPCGDPETCKAMEKEWQYYYFYQNTISPIEDLFINFLKTGLIAFLVTFALSSIVKLVYFVKGKRNMKFKSSKGWHTLFSWSLYGLAVVAGLFLVTLFVMNFVFPYASYPGM